VQTGGLAGLHPPQRRVQPALLHELLVGAGLDHLAGLQDVDAVRVPHGRQPVRGAVRFEGVRFAYGDGAEVLKGLDLDIVPGETHAIVGSTGAGKSTVVKLLLRLYEPTGGRITLDGVPLDELTFGSLRGSLGFVAQEVFLFQGTVRENLTYGRPDATEAEIVQAATLAEAHEFIAALPDGYATDIQEGGVNLSVGQRQLICMARAVLADPHILILDEATASVDTLTEQLIQDALQRLLAGRTAIVIAHRLSTIRNADLICVVQAGRIVERGQHETLVEQGGLYRQLYDRRFVDMTAGAAPFNEEAKERT
jgi:ABC-type multidrug transport system fused ATPase/permease subunit